MHEKFLKLTSAKLLRLSLEAHEEVAKLPSQSIVDLRHYCEEQALRATGSERISAQVIDSCCAVILEARGKA